VYEVCILIRRGADRGAVFKGIGERSGAASEFKSTSVGGEGVTGFKCRRGGGGRVRGEGREVKRSNGGRKKSDFEMKRKSWLHKRTKK